MLSPCLGKDESAGEADFLGRPGAEPTRDEGEDSSALDDFKRDPAVVAAGVERLGLTVSEESDLTQALNFSQNIFATVASENQNPQ